MKARKKYRPLTKEPMTRFVARIVDDEGEAMTADEVMTFCDKRHSRLQRKRECNSKHTLVMLSDLTSCKDAYPNL